MKKVLLLVFLHWSSIISALATSYYVDAAWGSDVNSGRGKTAAWQTLAKVNSVVFQPGDKIFFRSGGLWEGQLRPQGSGTASNPIIIGRYGKGPLPVISGNGVVASGVILLFNQSYWELNDLEIINSASTDAERRGVEIAASNFGLVEHIYLKGLSVHDIKGTIGNELSDKRSAGIYFTVKDDSQKPTRFNDIRVENCLIYNCQNQGIVTNNEVTVGDYPGTPKWEQRKYTNLVIRNNVIHHVSKNAMIIRLCDGGLVEKNLCYETATGTTGNTIFSRSSRNTVFQYNEGFLNRSPDFDGSLYDPDFSSPGTIWQYSYSHDNAHGLVWFCTTPRDTGIVVRHNLSRNDKGYLVYFNYAFEGASVHNNTFFTGPGIQSVIVKEQPFKKHKYAYTQNIVRADSSAVFMFSDTLKHLQQRDIRNNVFYGTKLPELLCDENNLNVDPMSSEDLRVRFPPGFMSGPVSPASRLIRQKVLPAEIHRETLRYRAVLHLDDSLLSATVKKKVAILKVQEELFRKNNLWPFKDYKDVLRKLKKENYQREKNYTSGFYFGPHVYTESTYYDYLVGNARIALLQMIIQGMAHPESYTETDEFKNALKIQNYKKRESKIEQILERWIEDLAASTH